LLYFEITTESLLSSKTNRTERLKLLFTLTVSLEWYILITLTGKTGCRCFNYIVHTMTSKKKFFLNWLRQYQSIILTKNFIIFFQWGQIR